MKHLSGIKPFSKAKRFFNPVVSELKSELAFGLLYSNPNLVRTSNYVNCVRPFTCTDTSNQCTIGYKHKEQYMWIVCNHNVDSCTNMTFYISMRLKKKNRKGGLYDFDAIVSQYMCSL